MKVVLAFGYDGTAVGNALRHVCMESSVSSLPRLLLEG